MHNSTVRIEFNSESLFDIGLICVNVHGSLASVLSEAGLVYRKVSESSGPNIFAGLCSGDLERGGGIVESAH